MLYLCISFAAWETGCETIKKFPGYTRAAGGENK
jgi:hypothetical protein